MLKRTFLRTHRRGMVRQHLARLDRGTARNFRSPDARRIITANRAYLALHPSWASGEPVAAEVFGSVS
ncbi:hypothetical protein [Streptomyces chryseus]|uniref:hypothetical protein n=1 Tax=Streptomyces chryseus TaxID=68186 RepID=UPI00110F9B8E|nr:hypothetical protein [Streptomyces chryseus]GGX26607.1 hypothetical protein GCM10010353_47070 [Streptomyces chryseus]